jgi:hypothetical protein
MEMAFELGSCKLQRAQTRSVAPASKEHAASPIRSGGEQISSRARRVQSHDEVTTTDTEAIRVITRGVE